MAKKPIDRPAFREWVDKQESPQWDLLPLTHITKGILLEDIFRSNKISPNHCEILEEDYNFLFYGRPAYRVSGDGSIKSEAACPTCLIFEPSLIQDAAKIHAFDTGAFGRRMYKHILLEEMQVEDFSLEKDITRPNKIIYRVFGNKLAYFNADTTASLSSDDGAEDWEFHTKAYLDLIKSPGRNEPDDRVSSIEVVIGGDIHIDGKLIGIVVPHTIWSETKKAPWLIASAASNVEIIPYIFLPNRHPEYYYALIEGVVRAFYLKKGIL